MNPPCHSPVSWNTLFLDMRNAQVWETEALDEALARVQSLLPASWSLTARPPFGDVEVAPCDRVVELASVAGDGASFTAETRRAGALPISQLLRNLRDNPSGPTA